MIPAYYKKRCAAFPFETGIHFRRKDRLLSRRRYNQVLLGSRTRTHSVTNRRGEPFSVAAGGYNFALLVTRITLNCSETDITLRKRSKIITLDEQSSMTVRDIATVVGVDRVSRVSRLSRILQNSGNRFEKEKENVVSNVKLLQGLLKL
ncbi:hypothetical protein TNCV_2348621 [Trichonephila clavipes]|uniref:Uncharacterized protein n=1 Tax=Trichonephila clavipes TaxID=2585209 RepID=A0A8X6SLZ0_TRICX|nr:hypothetical protein TNCV_2348621 [Trichonephila clavipes]